MSDVSPGEGWWQAADGRWYPPELRPAQQLVRQSSGATILIRPDDTGQTGDAASPGAATTGHDDVGGTIHSHTELYLGRPAGKQNRPAAWLAIAGSLMMLVGGLLPWAARSSTLDGSLDLGWRDATGAHGTGFYLVLIAVTVMTVAVRCMAGSYSRGWRAALVVLASGSIGVALVEAVRIQRAITEVGELSRGSASLSFGPGLLAVVAGAGIVLVAAGAYRVGSPD